MPKNPKIPTTQRAACEAHRTLANKRATELAPVVKALQATGVTSLNGIAAALNERGVPTVAGSGHWHPTQVRRVLARLTGTG
jgi:hypothetical protein